MGFWRTLYYYLDIEYIGETEQKQIEKQRRQKYLMCEQIKKSNIKLKSKDTFIDKIINQSIKKKNGKKRQRN
jgi:predicted DNA-binding helix-hairpin-helix protein